MAELRTDSLTGRAVLLAENRALRPNEFAVGASSLEAGCPFCAGNEQRTPPAVHERCDDAGCWQVRVVPNAFPAVNNLSGLPSSEMQAKSVDDVGVRSSSVGVHEVVIESPRHAERMSALTVAQLRHVLTAYAERLSHWRADGRLRYAIVFKNQGPRAGASLGHVHSQLMALPFVPPAVAAELERATEHRVKTRCCAYCDLIEQERSDGERVVWDRDGFLAFCPSASWQPREVWLMPTAHAPSFESSTPVMLDRLAPLLHELFVRLETRPASAEYNLLLRTAPWSGEFDEAFHWRIELLPRENSFAGCEVGAAVHINPLSPEQAARELRG